MSQLVIGAVLLAPLGMRAALPEPSLPVAALIGLSAFGSALGNFLIVQASRRAEASLIAPLIYSQLLSATAAGVLVFGDWPDRFALLGLVLIMVSGFGALAAQRRG